MKAKEKQYVVLCSMNCRLVLEECSRPFADLDACYYY